MLKKNVPQSKGSLSFKIIFVTFRKCYKNILRCAHLKGNFTLCYLEENNLKKSTPLCWIPKF